MVARRAHNPKVSGSIHSPLLVSCDRSMNSPTIVLWDIDGTSFVPTADAFPSPPFSTRSAKLPTCRPSCHQTRAARPTSRSPSRCSSPPACRGNRAGPAAAVREVYSVSSRPRANGSFPTCACCPAWRGLTRSTQHGVTQSLLTGNLEPIARLKLTCGIGRVRRLRVAPSAPIAKPAVPSADHPPAAARAPGEDANIVVIGDTPRDARARAAARARSPSPRATSRARN